MGNFLGRLSCMRREKYEVIPRSRGPWRHQFSHHIAAQQVKVFSISSSQAPPSTVSSVGATRDGSVWGVPHYLSNRPTILDYPWEMMEEQAWEDGFYIKEGGYGHLNEAYYSKDNVLA
ncbi:Protein of unknown function [Pyronema omphalodes CBS 100304]|uniref:Uncharacterized protein n=1 Tax=Pyronema omphalodes (strain CBS 100304) TaxID=1076935 RepID=U4KWK3_PYROM|nr:Protein of unknown function [Pyronema omphalodes CBS 100304]